MMLLYTHIIWHFYTNTTYVCMYVASAEVLRTLFGHNLRRFVRQLAHATAEYIFVLRIHYSLSVFWLAILAVTVLFLYRLTFLI